MENYNYFGAVFFSMCVIGLKRGFGGRVMPFGQNRQGKKGVKT
jgi:hypothetical protein